MQSATQRQITLGQLSLPLSEYDKLVLLLVDQQAAAPYVSKTAITTLGSNVVTLSSSASSTIDLFVGMVITHAGFTASVVIMSIIDLNSFTVSANASSATTAAITLTMNKAATTVSGSNVVTLVCGDTDEMYIGMSVQVVGNSAANRVTSIINSTSFTMSANATASGTSYMTTPTEFEYVMFTKIAAKTYESGFYQVPAGKTLLVFFLNNAMTGIMGYATSPLVEYTPSKRVRTFKKPTGWTPFGINSSDLKAVQSGLATTLTGATSSYSYMFPAGSYPCIKITSGTVNAPFSGGIMTCLEI